MADSYLAALIRERDHYLARGLKDRADQVEAQLSLLGHTEKRPAQPDVIETTTAEAPPETAAPPRPTKRSNLNVKE